MREDTQNSSANILSARYRNPSERPQIRDRLRNNDGNVFGHLGHRRQSAFKRLSDTYSLSTTKSGPDKEYSRDVSYSRGRPHKRDSSPSRDRPRNEEDLAVPWSWEEVDPFTPRIRNFKSSRKTQMPNNVKTYDGTGDLEDHVKIFHAASQVERWAMPTWCHMFNSTLIGTAKVWFDELSPESIYGYKDLKAAFLAYFMQQKKYVKNLVEIHNIKQKNGETIEDFIEIFKVETGRMKGASECMRISGFMHRVNNPELTKRLNEHVPKTVEEIMAAIASFIWGETVAASKKKVHTHWKSQEQSKRKNSKWRFDFRNQPRDGRGSNKFTPLTRTPKKFSRLSQKSSNHHRHGNPIEKEAATSSASSTMIKDIALMNVRDKDQQKTRKKDAPVKDKAAAIYMIQPWQRVTRPKVTQSFAHVKEIMFPPLTVNKGTRGPLVIEAKISGHAVQTYTWTETEKTRPGPEPAKAIQVEVQKLVEAGIMREVYYHDWIVTPFQKSIERSNPFAATPLSISWTPTKAIMKYRWLSKMRKRRLSTPVTGRKNVPMIHDKSGRDKTVPRQDERREHNITYRPRTYVKGQIVADFLVEKPDDTPPDTSVSKLHKSRGYCSRTDHHVLMDQGPIWMTPIMEYLKDGTLLGDKKKASKLHIKARQYELLEEVLYRQSFLKPRLRCVGPLQADYVIREIHEVSCSMHARPRSVVAKAMRLGYYWPTMHRDARDMIRTLKHSRSNRLVERANRSLGEGIKARLDEGNKNWIEELPHVLWAHRTMIKSSHDDTPFSLTYGTKSVILAEIRMPTYRTAVVDAVHNNEELRLNLDLLEEWRECAAIREAKAKLK
nr:reverse transcriptase domain-containing protein [Tanacetum cinerariifolium]